MIDHERIAQLRRIVGNVAADRQEYNRLLEMAYDEYRSAELAGLRDGGSVAAAEIERLKTELLESRNLHYAEKQEWKAARDRDEKEVAKSRVKLAAMREPLVEVPEHVKKVCLEQVRKLVAPGFVQWGSQDDLLILTALNADRAGPSEQQSGDVDARCEKCGKAHFEGDCIADPTYHERHFGSPAPAEDPQVPADEVAEIMDFVRRKSGGIGSESPAPATADAIDPLRFQAACAAMQGWWAADRDAQTFKEAAGYWLQSADALLAKLRKGAADSD